MKRAYQDIVEIQLKEGIIEKVPEQEADGERIFNSPHNPVVREETATTKVCKVFDASVRPSPMGKSLNECMYTCPALQHQLWDSIVRARMSASSIDGKFI